MGKRTNKKNISKIDKEKIKKLVQEYELLRLKDGEVLLNLGKNGFSIGNTTLYKLKTELREELGDKLYKLGRHELLYEHFLAIQMMQELERNLLSIMNDPSTSRSEKVKISSEIRSLIRDILDFQSSSEVVEGVFKYFQENYTTL